MFDNEKYVHLPSKADLDLGKDLAINFVAMALPDKLDEAYSIFNRKGAYSKFKYMLASSDKLESWYVYEDEQAKKAIVDWCNSVGFKT